MARFIELRCTSCDGVLSRVRQARVVIGSPFQECPRCGAFVPRESFSEWDVLGTSAKARYLAEGLALFLALGALPGLIYLLAALVQGKEYDWRVLVGLLVAGSLLVGALPVIGLVRTVKRSRQRLADPMYRAKLVEFGRRAARGRIGDPARGSSPP